MQKTTNYQLNQWVKSDRIQMEDFNSDNAKIDTVLKGNADKAAAALAAVASCGNCKIATGTYTGNGFYGKDHLTSLTFPFEPKLVIIQNKQRSMANIGATGLDPYGLLIALNPLKQFDTNNGYYHVYLSWKGNTVSWYGESADLQFNSSGHTFSYLALG